MFMPTFNHRVSHFEENIYRGSKKGNKNVTHYIASFKHVPRQIVSSLNRAVFLPFDTALLWRLES